jgi:hypothetical protein
VDRCAIVKAVLIVLVLTVAAGMRSSLSTIFLANFDARDLENHKKT